MSVCKHYYGADCMMLSHIPKFADVLPRVKHARTGLKIEKELYLAAQRKAAELGQSFAAYVTDLIASDISATCDGVDEIPDVRRIRGILVKKTPPGLRALQKEMRDEDTQTCTCHAGKEGRLTRADFRRLHTTLPP